MILETLIAASIVTAAAQSTTPVVKGPLDSVLWDYSFFTPENAQVDQFYVNIDSAATSSQVSAKNPISTGTSVGGAFVDATYAFKLPPLTVGIHTISVMACNQDLCSDPATLAFRLVITPGKPTNIRLGSGGSE